MTDPKDHWSSQAYQSSASFVPLLTSKVLNLLAPDPSALSSASILDLGCGDGVLTTRLAELAGSSGRVLALDASPSMIQSATKSHSSPNTEYRIQDCADLGADPEVISGKWDVVFSNAALHWILALEPARHKVFRDCYTALKPGGRLVFEMGGKGNVAEVEAAVTGALMAEGVGLEQVRAVRPWFFPSDVWMRKCLEDVGFEVEVAALEYRPTKLTTDQGGGLVGWVRLMCANFLEAIEEARRDAVVHRIVDALASVISREEDDSQWIGYVRLRVAARKKV